MHFEYANLANYLIYMPKLFYVLIDHLAFMQDCFLQEHGVLYILMCFDYICLLSQFSPLLSHHCNLLRQLRGCSLVRSSSETQIRHSFSTLLPTVFMNWYSVQIRLLEGFLKSWHESTLILCCSINSNVHICIYRMIQHT